MVVVPEKRKMEVAGAIKELKPNLKKNKKKNKKQMVKSKRRVYKEISNSISILL